MRAITLWPEWCPAFPGVRLTDGTASPLDKPCENRPMAPWSTIAPTMHGPGPWVAMHAGKYIGGKPTYAATRKGMEAVVSTANEAGWRVHQRGDDVRLYEPGDGPRFVWLHPDRIVRSAIVALIRVTRVAQPGEGGPWRFVDRFGWYVEVEPLARPIQCKGAQGLWTVPEAIVAEMKAIGARGAA